MSRAERARVRQVGELNEQRWSVVSERGREAAGLTYVDAAALVRRLLAEKVYGTCVVTDDAAARLNGNAPARAGGEVSAAAAPLKKPRARRRKRSEGDSGG